MAGHVRKLWIVVDYHSLGHVTEDLTGFIMPYTWTNGLTRSWWRDVSGFLDLWFQLRGKINDQNQVQTIDDGMHCSNNDNFKIFIIKECPARNFKYNAWMVGDTFICLIITEFALFKSLKYSKEIMANIQHIVPCHCMKTTVSGNIWLK